MKIVIADLHWKGHHTPYVSLLGEYLIENGNEVVFITSKSHQRLDKLPQDDMFRIKKLSVQPSDQGPGESLLSSVVEQKDRTQQIKGILKSTNEVHGDVLHLLWFDTTLVPYRVATLLTRNDFSVVGTLHRDAFTSPADGGFRSKVTKKLSALSLDSVLKHDALDVLTVHSDSIQERLLEQLDSASKKKYESYLHLRQTFQSIPVRRKQGRN